MRFSFVSCAGLLKHYFQLRCNVAGTRVGKDKANHAEAIVDRDRLPTISGSNRDTGQLRLLSWQRWISLVLDYRSRAEVGSIDHLARTSGGNEGF
jgi:hypothetical protein